MTKPRPVATVLIDGILLCCLTCQRSPLGTAHTGKHQYWTNAPGRSGVLCIEWVDVPKPKRAKRKKGGRRGRDHREACAFE